MVLCRKFRDEYEELTEAKAREAIFRFAERPIGERTCFRPQRHTIEDTHPPIHDGRVRTTGLKNLKYDCRDGRIISWHKPSSRYAVQLGSDSVRIKPVNLLCLMYDEDEGDSGPTWCNAARQVVISWQPGRASKASPDVSLQLRAAETLIAAGVSSADLAKNGHPDDIVRAVRKAERCACMSVSVPYDEVLWLHLGNMLIENGDEPRAFEHPTGLDGIEWRLTQCESGARYELPVCTDDDVSMSGDSGYNSELAEMVPYYQTLKAISQLVARSFPPSWRVVADPPLCIVPSALFGGSTRLVLGCPIFFCGPEDENTMVWSDNQRHYDHATQLLSDVKDRVKWPPTVGKPSPIQHEIMRALGSNMWSFDRERLHFMNNFDSDAGSSDDDTRCNEFASLRSCMHELARLLAQQFRESDCRADIVVRVEFDDGDGCCAVEGFPYEDDHSLGFAVDEYGEYYLEWDKRAEVVDEYSVQEIVNDAAGQFNWDGRGI
jgi:hypothetical protein